MTERDWADEVAQNIEAYCFTSSMRNHSTDHVAAALRAAYNRGVEMAAKYHDAKAELFMEFSRPEHANAHLNLAEAIRALLIPETK